ncbi:MAG: carboxymuconolactone decarboxylase family protein [Acidobacteria bacterium]|nr:carboxymuconolactone decarboxylase family protein [Acidobacteriota bacterium]
MRILVLTSRMTPLSCWPESPPMPAGANENDEGSKDYGLDFRAHFDLYVTLMRGKSGLSRIQREMIGLVVSAANHCHY